MKDTNVMNDEDALDFFEKTEPSWIEENRGAIIFYFWVGVIVVFGIFPWMTGAIKILNWIF